jgi:hypothetical protein
METNGTPPSARRMWHERAAHACDFAQRYAEPLDDAVSQRMIELSRQRRGLNFACAACCKGDGPVRRPCLNQRNQSDRQDNTRQPQLCSMPVSVSLP